MSAGDEAGESGRGGGGTAPACRAWGRKKGVGKKRKSPGEEYSPDGLLEKKSPGDDLLSHAQIRSIIGDGGLNCRVRDGNGCTPSSMVTRTNI